MNSLVSNVILTIIWHSIQASAGKNVLQNMLNLKKINSLHDTVVKYARMEVILKFKQRFVSIVHKTQI